MIKDWSNIKLVFARSIMTFGTYGSALRHCTHIQIVQAVPLTKKLKRVHFFTALFENKLNTT